jgi:AcrR family transcriptional regulator
MSALTKEVDMRVTAARRETTRRRILARARRLFASREFDSVTTREIAAAAGIATGTLFNYHPTKEELALELLAADCDRALARFRPRRRGEETLEEDLFSLVLATLRAMAPLRRTVGPVLASTLGPWTADAAAGAASRLRLRVLEKARSAIARHGVPFGEDPVSAHLFWTLYLGALAFWCSDETPGQEDTLALLDQSMRLFARSLPAEARPREVEDAE